LLTGCVEGTELPTSSPGDDPGDRVDFDLDPKTERALILYPLHEGSSWVYDYLGYNEQQEVVWRVVETVVDAYLLDGYYVAELERSVELLSGEPPQDFVHSPQQGKFWYVIDGENLYRFDSAVHTDLSDAWLDLVLPFPKNGQGWYPDPDKRSQAAPGLEGFRTASDPYQEGALSGESYTCYNVITEVAGAKQEATFCETVGFFYLELINFEQSTGYRIELRAFSLQ
jgi:hypothetical protein